MSNNLQTALSPKQCTDVRFPVELLELAEFYTALKKPMFSDVPLQPGIKSRTMEGMVITTLINAIKMVRIKIFDT